MAECECEREPQSEHDGPGVVTSDEHVLRLVFHDEQIRPDGSLEPTTFSKSDFERPDPANVALRGFSVNRRAHATKEILERKAQDHHGRAKQPEDRKEVWAYRSAVTEMRGLKLPDGSRMTCVVDRAEPDDCSHAELWGSQKRSQGQLRAIRDTVVSKLTKDYRVLKSGTA